MCLFNVFRWWNHVFKNVNFSIKQQFLKKSATITLLISNFLNQQLCLSRDKSNIHTNIDGNLTKYAIAGAENML